MLSRKLTRLRSMSTAEITYRLREWAATKQERHAWQPDEDPARDRDDLPLDGVDGEQGTFLGFLRERAARRFYVTVAPESRRPLARLFARRFPARLSAAWDEAERLCTHRLELLGHGEIDLGTSIEWHRDPVSGRPWERRFWSDYDLTRDSRAGDPKRVLELNRHQHLPRLAKAYWLFDEERYAREVLDEMDSWIEQNPPGLGIHWHSSHDIALRALSWIWALLMVLPSKALDEARARRIGSSLFEQLDHVHRHPSLYTSPNTHLLGEATALFVAGLTFGVGPSPRAWLAKGAELLVSQLRRQVLPDGVHAELSTWYHCHALDGYLQAIALARHHGWPLRLERVSAMLDFLLHVTRPDGSVPPLSDDDGGRTLALAQTHYRDASDLLCTGAILRARDDLKEASGGMREEALWLTGAWGLSKFDSLASPRLPPLHASFPDAGYFVQRTGWGPDDSHLVFDCGGPGTLGGGHAHADALSFTLFSRGNELVVDPGTFVYNGMPRWRDAFRGTGAHNTAVVDGRDAWVPGATFQWRKAPVPRQLADMHLDGNDYVAGEMVSGAPGVVHRRRLLFVRPDYWLMLDDFRGKGEHAYELVFHLAPDAEVRREPDSGPEGVRLRIASGRAGLLLALHGTAPLDVHVVRAGSHPLGWVSHRYGEMQAAPVVVVRCSSPAPAAILTVLAPFAVGEEPPRVHPVRIQAEAGKGPVLATRIQLGSGEEDLGMIAASSLVARCALLGDEPVRGEVVWARLRDGHRERMIVIDGSSGSLHGESTAWQPDGSKEEVAPCAR